MKQQERQKRKKGEENNCETTGGVIKAYEERNNWRDTNARRIGVYGCKIPEKKKKAEAPDSPLQTKITKPTTTGKHKATPPPSHKQDNLLNSASIKL